MSKPKIKIQQVCCVLLVLKPRQPSGCLQQHTAREESLETGQPANIKSNCLSGHLSTSSPTGNCLMVAICCPFSASHLKTTWRVYRSDLNFILLTDAKLSQEQFPTQPIIWKRTHSCSTMGFLFYFIFLKNTKS